MKKTLTLLLFLAPAFFGACGDEEPPPGPQPVVMNTPAAVLENVEYSWDHRDIDLFKATLSTNFVFYFNPNDVGSEVNGYIIPTSWNYQEMTTAVGNMLAEVYSVSLRIPTENVGTPPSGATTYEVDNVNISFLLYVTEDDGFKVDSGYCNFEFEKYLGADEKYYWRLTKWRDFTAQSYMASAAGVTPTSLGKVLALYR